MFATFPPMKTHYYTASSLDGFIATEDDAREVVGPKLRLVSSTPMGPGMIELRYEVDKGMTP